MGNKNKKKARLQVVPSAPEAVLPLPQTPAHRAPSAVQQELMNLLAILGQKHFAIKVFNAEIDQLNVHTEKLSLEYNAAVASEQLKSAESAKMAKAEGKP